MRECIYCGRQLGVGEKCTCAMSEAKRRQKGEEPIINENSKDKKRAEKEKKKQEAKERRSAQREARKTQWRPKGNMGEAFSELKRLAISFIKSPVETVMNPGYMSKTVIFLFIIIEGIIGGMCVFAVTTGAVRGPIGTLGAMMGFGGLNGYELVRGWVMSALSGAISGMVIFFVYSGVFYLVNKFIYKQFTPYWEFVKRFVFAPIPLTVIGTVGVLFGLFSYTTFLILLISGLCGVVLVTYEIIKSVWYMKSPTKTIYTMMLCIFVIITVLMSLMRFA